MITVNWFDSRSTDRQGQQVVPGAEQVFRHSEQKDVGNFSTHCIYGYRYLAPQYVLLSQKDFFSISGE